MVSLKPSMLVDPLAKTKFMKVAMKSWRLMRAIVVISRLNHGQYEDNSTPGTVPINRDTE